MIFLFYHDTTLTLGYINLYVYCGALYLFYLRKSKVLVSDMLNLSKVSSGSGELSEIDISSVIAERSSERSSPVLSLRIGLLRKAHPGFRRRLLLGVGLYECSYPP